MRRLLLPITAIALLLYSCTNEVKKQANKQQPDTVAATLPAKKPGHNILSFENPVRIAGSDFVMYPLAIKNDESSGFITKSSGRSTALFWNFAFYNTATGEHHLLNKSQKMLVSIYGDSGQGDVIMPPGKTDLTDSLIFYSVRIKDFNNDGELDFNDPDYLFTSDKNGNNFKQISPGNFNVVSWQAVSSAGKILIQAAADINNDKKFDEDDKVVPYVYDLKTGKLTQVFSEDFINNTGKLFEKHWADKK